MFSLPCCDDKTKDEAEVKQWIIVTCELFAASKEGVKTGATLFCLLHLVNILWNGPPHFNAQPTFNRLLLGKWPHPQLAPQMDNTADSLPLT